MKNLFRIKEIAVIGAMLVAPIAWPVAAANTLSSDEYLTMVNSKADETDMPDSAQSRQLEQDAVAAARSAEDTEITAARLGVMTPYGKRALVQELRNYYPASYRDFRGLDNAQVNELVVLFEANGNLNQVLANMDQMLSKAR